MNQEDSTVDLYLTPSPGAKPEFLATVQLVTDIKDGDGTNNEQNIEIWNDFRKKVLLDNTKNPVTVANSISTSDSHVNVSTTKNRRIVVLEDYTRESWAWKPIANSGIFHAVTLDSIDGRNKLPGFVKYLKDRQKSVYGRLYPTYIFVISYIQNSGTKIHPNRVDCRLCLDMTLIPNISLTPKQQPSKLTSNGNGSSSNNNIDQSKLQQHTSALTMNVPQVQVPGSSSVLIGKTISTTTEPPKQKKSGLLGSLVGAQKRTNLAVAVSNTPSTNVFKVPQKAGTSENTLSKSVAPQATTAPNIVNKSKENDQNGDGDVENNNNSSNDDVSSSKLKTAQEVFAEFRQYCSEIMLDFDMEENEELMKIPINLPEYTTDMISNDEKAKVTMEILKYMIYEAAEEVNESWIAVKEPTEFMDEMTIVIYKEGAAPEEVIEEMNKGDLPDEIVQQQRAIASQRQRDAEMAHQKAKRITEKQVHQIRGGASSNGSSNFDREDNVPDDDNDDDNFASLNKSKRDRRSVEEYERENKKQQRA
jgi:hypothetical protein